MRIGVLGGTFDPPHIGHLVIAEEARVKLALARVYFVPAREPPHKLSEPVTPLADRIEMLALALGKNPYFRVSLAEAQRPGPSYSVDTIRGFKSDLPVDTELFFIMGMDSLISLPTWHEPGELVRLCRLAVLRRPGYPLDLDALELKMPGLRERLVFVPAPELDLSSTELQAAVRSGRSVHYLVPEGVETYINASNLYR